MLCYIKMAANRCFTTFTPNQFASDYLSTRRQKTLFNEVNNNIITLNNANPKKKNGFRYNSNFSVRPMGWGEDGETENSCLVFAKDHQLLMDITKGETIYKNQSINCNTINPKQKMDAPVFEAWSGNMYAVNYAKHNVTNVVEFINPPTAVADPSYCIVDPAHVLFDESCPLTGETGYPPEWFRTVDISFNNTTYYTEANQSQTLNGLYYPAGVTFGTHF